MAVQSRCLARMAAMALPAPPRMRRSGPVLRQQRMQGARPFLAASLPLDMPPPIRIPLARTGNTLAQRDDNVPSLGNPNGILSNRITKKG